MSEIPGLDDHLDNYGEPGIYGPEPCNPANGNDPEMEEP